MDGKILIAVDFGTTYSAIGYAFVKDTEKAEDVVLEVIDKDWPGQGRRRSPKIPSVFRESGSEFQFGFQAQNEPESVCFAKLFLDPDQVEQARELATFTSTTGSHSVEDLTKGVTRFLGSLREHVLQHMIREKKWEKSFIDTTKKEYVLSVPAVWSDKAKDRTIQCAINAGYGTKGDPSSVRLVAEPEAAAVYTITTIPKGTLEVNDVFVVCDAGGGTVDLATYRIVALHPNVWLEEAAVGTGGLCGSVLLNQRFRALVEQRIGKMSLESIQDIEEQFNDDIKPTFTGDDTDYIINVDEDLLDDTANGLENGQLTLTLEDLRDIFDPVITPILLMLDEQIKSVKNVRKNHRIPILLVGGFGSSEYLKGKVRHTIKNCEVIQPPDAWSAVVRGALLRSMIKKRKIRGAYGVKFYEPWGKKHETGEISSLIDGRRDEYRFWDAYNGDWLCKDRMEWYVKKGDEFSETKVVSFPFYQTVGIGHSLKFEIDLWAYMDGWEGENGPLLKDMSCRRVGRLRPDLSKVPRQTLTKLRSPDGEPYYKVNYLLEMSFDTVISFRLRFNGALMGEVAVEYIDATNDAGKRSN